METIEVPRFLLTYFDSNTVRTPLTSIQGYARVMVQGVAGPITEDQKHFLEVIQHNAEFLFRHFSIFLQAQRYAVYEHHIAPSKILLQELVDYLNEALGQYPSLNARISAPDEKVSFWGDIQHIYEALDCVVRFLDYITGNTVAIRFIQNAKATSIEIEFSKTDFIKSGNYYLEPYRFVTQRVMDLHGGTYTLKDISSDKMLIALAFPNLSKSTSA